MMAMQAQSMGWRETDVGAGPLRPNGTNTKSPKPLARHNADHGPAGKLASTTGPWGRLCR